MIAPERHLAGPLVRLVELHSDSVRMAASALAEAVHTGAPELTMRACLRALRDCQKGLQRATTDAEVALFLDGEA